MYAENAEEVKWEKKMVAALLYNHVLFRSVFHSGHGPFGWSFPVETWKSLAILHANK